MKKAYLIIDMSNDFVADDGKLTVGKPAQEMVLPILETAKEYLKNGDIVVFCNDSHEEFDKHFELWPPHCIKHTKGMMPFGDLMTFYDDHKDSENVFFLPKSEYDAFYKTPLKELLDMNTVDEVRLCGVCTDICIYQTIYGAYKAGFKTIVKRSECATFTSFGDVFLSNAAVAFKTEIL